MGNDYTFWMVLSTRSNAVVSFNDKISAIKNATYYAEAEMGPGSVLVLEVRMTENPLDADGKSPQYRYTTTVSTVLTL